MQKKFNLRPFIQKMRFKYRVSVLNENTLEESWHIRLSRYSVFMLFSTFITVTFILLTILIFNTPIAHYLPGYGDTGNRGRIIKESMRADSLLQEINLQKTYLAVVKKIITGEIQADKIPPLDSSLSMQERTTILEKKTKHEKKFVEQFEKEEKFNVVSVNTQKEEDTHMFFRPVRGVITSSFSVSNQRNGIHIITSPNESVLSVLQGTVIYTAFTFDFNWVIQVQHANNYLSIYKNNIQLFKKVGDKVNVGECIAITGESSVKKKKSPFYFELWKEGRAINPENIITF